MLFISSKTKEMSGVKIKRASKNRYPTDLFKISTPSKILFCFFFIFQ